MFNKHPFLQNNNTHILPPQMLNSSEKNEEWKIQCMDALEYIARMQWLENQKLVNNYKLINGEFIASDYILEESYKEPLDIISSEYNLPSFIKNYDIISQPINRLVGEIDMQPDTFNVIGKGDLIEGEYLRNKSELIKNSELERIEKNITLKLIEKGLDPFYNEFETEEERQQYVNKINQERETILKPLEIESWLSKNYKHMAVQWGEIELEDQKERFNLQDLKRNEFRDLLVVGKRFRHIYLKANGFNVESCNPISVFYHKSPDVKYVQDGDYVGRIFICSLPEIIDRYGYKMTSDQLKSLQKSYEEQYKSQIVKKTAFDNKKIDYLSPLGIPYVTPVPTLNRFVNDFIPQVKDFPSNNWILTEEMIDAINGKSNYLSAIEGMYQVTEGYWKSFQKIGKLVWINPETEILEKILIDDNFIIPDYIKEISDKTIEFSEEDEINTITWTWVNKVWSGIKISNAGVNGSLESIYLNVGEHDIQFKGETLIYECKLPIAGQIINNKNTVSVGLVDLIKPEQFFYNVLMNQSYKFLEKEIIPFLIMDSNLIPNTKDWGQGKNKNLENWLSVAKLWGIVPSDTSPENTGGANVNGQFPRVIDMDMSQRILSRLSMAQQIKATALEKIGMAPQRLGDVKSSETATGINIATANSSIQTSYWFSEFFACEKEILKMQLSVAQMLQSKNKDIQVTATKSDLTNAFLRFTDNDFSLYDLHVYISNSQKSVRDLEMIRRLGIENNTLMTKMSDRIIMATSNSIPTILDIIKNTEKQNEERQLQQQELQEQQLQQNKEIAQIQLEQNNEHFYAKLENDLQKEYIRAFGFNEDANEDLNNNQVPDILESLKFIENKNLNDSKTQLEKLKLNQTQNKYDSDLNLQRQKLEFEKLKEANKMNLAKIQLKRDQIRGDKTK